MISNMMWMVSANPGHQQRDENRSMLGTDYLLGQLQRSKSYSLCFRGGLGSIEWSYTREGGVLGLCLLLFIPLRTFSVLLFI